MKDDKGSILVLGVGLSVICIALITTLVNVSTIWIARNTLDSVADGAALAAVQAVDTRSVYTNGLGSALRLNRAQARIKARQYVSRANVQGDVHNARIVSMQVTGQTVAVTLASDIQLPFGYLATTQTVAATSRAHAINKLR